MAIRITGMNSGLDTDAIISEMVSAQRTKVQTYTKQQTSLEWKQEIWNQLNTKALKLFNGTLSNMRFTDAYSKKASTVSNSDAVSVLTGGKAVNGVQKLQIKELAETGYLTGAKLGNSVTDSTKLSELTGIGEDETLNFSVTSNGKTTDISLSGSSKISDVVSKLKQAGINANFDTANKRMFLSATSTGKDADFALSANDDNGFKALTALGINMSDSYAYLAKMSDGEKQAWIENETAIRVKNTKSSLDKAQADLKKANASDGALAKSLAALQDKGYADDMAIMDAFVSLGEERTELLKNLEEPLDDDATDEQIQQREEWENRLAEVNKDLGQIEAYHGEVKKVYDLEQSIINYNKQLANDNEKITEAVTAELESKVNFAKDVVADPAAYTFSAANRIAGRDATIVLNGAEFTSKSNTIEVNGLTFTAKQETGDEVITVTTQDDTEGIYDMVKSFIKEYNALINEMDKLYNAESARDYQPLTDEEKDAMSDTEIENWENKIKDSLLRRDSSLSSISGIMKDAMASAVEVGGKNYYLSSFGIEAISYFLSEDNEKNAYHIHGDADDSYTSGETDKLKNMIASNPDTVTQFFTGLAKNLYGKMQEVFLDSSQDFKSVNKLYNDKKMKSDYDNYTKRIAEQEAKAYALEEKYYKQFSAMEVAMAKMQSSQSALSGLLGG